MVVFIILFKDSKGVIENSHSKNRQYNDQTKKEKKKDKENKNKNKHCRQKYYTENQRLSNICLYIFIIEKLLYKHMYRDTREH